MTTPTFQDAIATQSAQQIRDSTLLPALAAAGSTVGGAPTSSPDRGIVEAEAAFLALEQQLRAGVALSISATTALQAGDSWVDAAASWYQVPSNQGPGNTPGGIGRFVATFAVWSVPMRVTPSAAPLTISPGQIVQAQADTGQIFNLTLPAGSPPLVFNSGNSFTATAMFTARVAGVAAGKVTANTITKIITGPAGLSITGSGQTLVTAPQDQETSAALLVRCYGRWGTIGAGWTLQSFDFLIPSFAADVNRWFVDDSNAAGPGSVVVSLAIVNGPASGPSSTPGTDCALVLAGLGSSSVKPLGSGPIVVQPAVAVPIAIAAVLATDGSNSTLIADATDALQQLASKVMGPAAITFDLIVAILMGAPLGTVEIPTTVGGGTARSFQINLPGFGGVAYIQTGFGGVQLAAGQILTITPTITTQAP